MNNNLNLDNIRLLLHKYYEGETIPEEESLLEKFFRDHTEEEIPEDMVHTAGFFRAVSELHPDDADMTVPDSLIEKISEITDGSDGLESGKIHNAWKSRIVYVISAASVGLLLALGLRSIYISDNQTPKSLNQTAATLEIPSRLPPEKFEANSISEQSAPEQLSSATEVLNSNTKAEPNVRHNVEDGYIEITDPEEAQKIIKEIGWLLTINSQKTNEAIHQIENTIDEYKELTKSILQ